MEDGGYLVVVRPYDPDGGRAVVRLTAAVAREGESLRQAILADARALLTGQWVHAEVRVLPVAGMEIGERVKRERQMREADEFADTHNTYGGRFETEADMLGALIRPMRAAVADFGRLLPAARTLPTPRDEQDAESGNNSSMDASIGALIAAFERFYETLHASTKPLADSGRVVAGIPHAVALSEAAASLCNLLGLVYLGTIADHAEPIRSLPPGVALNESDSPHGPWTPVPPDRIRLTRAPIGGAGMNPTLVAAIQSATDVAAMPVGRHNAGVRQRFLPGDVLSRDQLDTLDNARDLLAIERRKHSCSDSELELAARSPATGATRRRKPTQHTDEPTPTKLDYAILKELSTRTMATERAKLDGVGGANLNAIYKRLTILHEWGFVHAPPAGKHGTKILDAGRVALATWEKNGRK